MLRALIPLLGMKSANVYYDRCERLAGESKYPFLKCNHSHGVELQVFRFFL